MTIEIPGAAEPTNQRSGKQRHRIAHRRPGKPHGAIAYHPARQEHVTATRHVCPCTAADKFDNHPERITIPATAVITRSELTAVYVVDGKGNASLRQVRLGRPQGNRIEVQAGLDAGETIALDPLAAAKQH